MCAGALARHRHLNVLTRHGAPHFLRDLEGVSAGQAKTIIILQPDTAKVRPASSVWSSAIRRVFAFASYRAGHDRVVMRCWLPQYP